MKKLFLLIIACFLVVGCVGFGYGPYDDLGYTPIEAESEIVDSAEPFNSAYSTVDPNGHRLTIPALNLSFETDLDQSELVDGQKMTLFNNENGFATLRLLYKPYTTETDALKILETELADHLKTTSNSYAVSDLPMGYQIKDDYKIAYTRFFNGLDQTDIEPYSASKEGSQLAVITYPDGYVLLSGRFSVEDLEAYSPGGMRSFVRTLDSIEFRSETNAGMALPTATATPNEFVTTIDPYLFSFEHPQELVFNIKSSGHYVGDTSGDPNLSYTYPNTELDGHLTFYFTTTRETDRFAQTDLSDVLQTMHASQIGSGSAPAVAINQFDSGDQIALADPIVEAYVTDDGASGEIVKNLGILKRSDGSLKHFHVITYDKAGESANQETAQQIVNSFQFP